MPKLPQLETSLGAIVLCGGKSTRLGIDKTQLIFHGQTFLERVVSQVEQVCHPVVLVGDADFSQHQLPPNVQWATDEHPNCGPLEGIRVGLAKLASQVDFAFVTSCDVPLIDPQLIRFLFHKISDRGDCDFRISVFVNAFTSCSGVALSRFNVGAFGLSP